MSKSYTPAELAELWGCSGDHIRLLIADGELMATNIGRGGQRARWIISDEAVEAFLAKRKSVKEPKPKRRSRGTTKPTRSWV